MIDEVRIKIEYHDAITGNTLTVTSETHRDDDTKPAINMEGYLDQDDLEKFTHDLISVVQILNCAPHDPEAVCGNGITRQM